MNLLQRKEVTERSFGRILFWLVDVYREGLNFEVSVNIRLLEGEREGRLWSCLSLPVAVISDGPLVVLLLCSLLVVCFITISHLS